MDIKSLSIAPYYGIVKLLSSVYTMSKINVENWMSGMNIIIKSVNVRFFFLQVDIVVVI